MSDLEREWGYKARHGVLCDMTVNAGVHGCDCELATFDAARPSDGLREALDDALGALTEDDIEYHTDPAGPTALEPNEPDLWVNYAALRTALSKEERP